MQIVCVQNHYNVAHRADDGLMPAGDESHVPFNTQRIYTTSIIALSDVAHDLDATPMQIALAAPSPRAEPAAYSRHVVAAGEPIAADLGLSDAVLRRLNGMAA